MKKYNVGVMGATGAVGQQMIKVLGERNFPVGELRCLASERSEGKVLMITDDPAYFLVSNGIQEIRENGFGRENIPAMMAAVVVISAPLIVLFLIFRKKIMAGVSRGGTKG